MNSKPVLINHRFGIRTVLNAAFVVFAAAGALLLAIQSYAAGITWMVGALMAKTLDLYFEWRWT